MYLLILPQSRKMFQFFNWIYPHMKQWTLNQASFGLKQEIPQNKFIIEDPKFCKKKRHNINIIEPYKDQNVKSRQFFLLKALQYFIFVVLHIVKCLNLTSNWTYDTSSDSGLNWWTVCITADRDQMIFLNHSWFDCWNHFHGLLPCSSKYQPAYYVDLLPGGFTLHFFHLGPTSNILTPVLPMTQLSTNVYL